MERRMKASAVRQEFGSVLDSVSEQNDRVIVERAGAPVAVIVPLHVYQSWKRNARDRWFELMNRAAHNANLTPEEGERLAQEAVDAARAEHQS